MRSSTIAIRAAATALVLTVAGCSHVVDGRAVGPVPRGNQTAGPSTGSSATGAVFRDPDNAADILRDARAAIRATSSYSYRDLPGARAAGLRYVTGTYREQFARAFDTLIAVKAPSLHVTQRTKVSHVGLGPADALGASVLAYGYLDVDARDFNDHAVPFGLSAHLRSVGSRWLLDRVTVDGTVYGVPPSTLALSDAVLAARKGVEDLSTLDRASFSADYGRLLELLTGTLRDDVAARRATTRRKIIAGDFDLTAAARGIAIEVANGTSATILVVVDDYEIKNGHRGLATRRNFSVGLIQRDGRWLLSSLEPVGAR